VNEITQIRSAFKYLNIYIYIYMYSSKFINVLRGR
jgi:hypothetical protein